MKKILKNTLAVVTAILLCSNCFSQTVIKTWAKLITSPSYNAMTIDKQGNIYTADFINSTICKITSAGIVTQVWASLDSNANPIALAIDKSGNIYTANNGNSTVSRITSSGTVSNNWAILSIKAKPTDIKLDTFGNVYTANHGNTSISKITQSGIITRSYAKNVNIYRNFAVNGSGNIFYIPSPVGLDMVTVNGLTTTTNQLVYSGAGAEGSTDVAIDNSGNSYYASGAWTVKNSSSGELLNSWDIGRTVFRIIIDNSGNIFTARTDYSSNTTIGKVSSSGIVTQVWASMSGGINDIVSDMNGDIFTLNNDQTIGNISSSGFVTKSWANIGYPSSVPSAIVVDTTGNIFTLNKGNNTISKITPSGNVTQAWITLSKKTGSNGMTIDKSGNIYISNLGDSTISKISSSGSFTPKWATLKYAPNAITSDVSGNVFTACTYWNIITKITSTGIVTQNWAQVDNTSGPTVIITDVSGNVYAASNANESVSKISAFGIVTTPWGKNFFRFSINDIAVDLNGNAYYTASPSMISKLISDGTTRYLASFSASVPKSIIVDKSGNIYTTNSNDHDYWSVNKTDSAGSVIESWAILDSLADSKGIVMDKLGNIYTVNAGTNSVSKIIPSSITPLSYISFGAFREKENINLKWHTATELNTSNFIIQHSLDGSSFTDIGTVKAIGSGANEYQFTDNNPTPYPLNGVLYYRLKSADKDGSFTYSKTVSVQLTINNYQLSIYPNPAKSSVTIRGNHIVSVQVVDNLGRIIKTQILKDATNPKLSVGGLPTGIYHLRVQTTDGKVNGVGFVKE